MLARIQLLLRPRSLTSPVLCSRRLTSLTSLCNSNSSSSKEIRSRGKRNFNRDILKALQENLHRGRSPAEWMLRKQWSWEQTLFLVIFLPGFSVVLRLLTLLTCKAKRTIFQHILCSNWSLKKEQKKTKGQSSASTKAFSSGYIKMTRFGRPIVRNGKVSIKLIEVAFVSTAQSCRQSSVAV